MDTLRRLVQFVFWMLFMLSGLAVLTVIAMNPKWAVSYHGPFYNGAGSSGTFYVLAVSLAMIWVGIVKLRRLFKSKRRYRGKKE